MDFSRFPDPYRTRSDVSHASVFLVAILLLVAVASVLFFGTSWVFAPADALVGRASSAIARPTAADRTPVRPPATFGAPSVVPPLAGVIIQPTPTPGPPGTPAPAAPTSAPTPSATEPRLPPSPTVLPSPTALPVGRVGNTGGDGVYLRRTPRMDDRSIAWADNTQLILLGAEATGDGQNWVQVRDPMNNVGWVPVQFVVR